MQIVKFKTRNEDSYTMQRFLRKRQILMVTLAMLGAFFLLVGSASAQTLGENITFNTESDFDVNGRTSVSATLVASGTYSLIYIEDTYANSLSTSNEQALLNTAIALRDEFDNTIYPGITEFYGKPFEPGIDNDVRITLLLTEMKESAGGYFDTSDEFTKQQSPESNEREMLYLNATFYTNPRRIYSFVSHEMTHLVDFYQKKLLRSVDEEVWLNELKAEYGSTRVGYDSPYAGSNLASRVASFLSYPSTSLTEWQNKSEGYAVNNIFSQYLVGKYGQDALKYAMQSELSGIASIDSGLAQVGAGLDFADVFQDWVVASYINNSQPGLIYVYDHPSLTGEGLRIASVTTSAVVGVGGKLSMTRQIEDWAGQWLKVVPTNGGTETMMLNLSADVPIRAKVALKHSNGDYTVQEMTPISGGVTTAVPDLGMYTEIIVMPVLMGKTSGFSTGASDGAYPSEPLRSYTLEAQRIPADVPILTKATPTLSIPGGGVVVTLFGTGFTKNGTPTVKIDGQNIAVGIVDDTELSFIAPARAEGDVCISVTVGTITSQRCDIFGYGYYQSGSLVRAVGTPEVWIINGSFRRHIVTSRVFDFYGHLNFDAVVEVTQEELSQYRISAWVRANVTGDPSTWRIYEVNADASKHWITCADSDRCGATWIANGGDPAGIYTINQTEMDFYRTGERVFLQ